MYNLNTIENKSRFGILSSDRGNGLAIDYCITDNPIWSLGMHKVREKNVTEARFEKLNCLLPKSNGMM
jgi:hypothetical protein